jgi:hypothetical protein
VEHRADRKRSAHWRGHLFLFDKKTAPAYDARAGFRLLLIFLALEGVIGPRLSLFKWLHLPPPPLWLRVPVLLCVALLLVRFVARVKLSQIGLYRWREWSGTERSYFVQLVIIANIVFLVREEPNKLVVLFGSTVISLPLFVRDAVMFALGGTPFEVRDLPGELDDDGKLVLARRLLKEGLLTRQD